ncbi:MAG: DNA repair protein RecO [Thermoguttaceae bacterium]|nr:DNA repair protein RecO [Thermoguttaceae bacterium]
MPIETSAAVVIKSVDFSETSLILTLFTRDLGKIQGIAKGGRRLKNPFDFALDLLTQICVSFIHKTSDALDILTEAKLIHRFRPSACNLKGLYAGYYVAELLGVMTPDAQPMPELFDLAVTSLNRFETVKEPALDLLRFEWGLLTLSGQEPSTHFCVGCGREVPVDDLLTGGRRISFATLDGGTICRACRAGGNFQQTASISAPALRLLQCLGESDRLAGIIVPDPTLGLETQHIAVADGESGGKKYVRRDDGMELFSTAVLKEVRGLMTYYMTQLLGRRPVMYEYLARI